MKVQYNKLVLIALIIALAALILPQQEDIAFEIVKNNTDLCDFNHTSLLCNGIRQSNVTYYTNNTPIVLYVFAHASSTGGVAGVFLYRDDVLIEAQSGRPLAAPEQTWRGVTAIIPKNSSYRVNFTNYHHFEWYEDQILSGRNGTLSINNTYNNYTNITGGGCTGDCAFNNLTVNSLGKNNTSDSYLNSINLRSALQSRDVNLDSKFEFTNLNSMWSVSRISSVNISDITITPENIHFGSSNANSSEFNIEQKEILYNIDGRIYTYTPTYFDMGGANLTNCANCSGNQNLNQVLAVGTDANNQDINNLKNLTMTGYLKLNATTPYTGLGWTILDMGRNSTVSKARVVINDLNGAMAFRANVKDDLTQDNTSWSGVIFALRPQQGLITFYTIAPGTTTLTQLLDIGTNGQNVTVYGNITVNKMSGVGNAYVCADANGNQFRKSSPCV